MTTQAAWKDVRLKAASRAFLDDKVSQTAEVSDFAARLQKAPKLAWLNGHELNIAPRILDFRNIPHLKSLPFSVGYRNLVNENAPKGQVVMRGYFGKWLDVFWGKHCLNSHFKINLR